jgi:glycogen debranching enzyme
LTGPAFYAFVASSLWHWTGDKDLVKPFIEPALKGLRWRDEYADLRQDGFSWYQTRSTQGLKNQGWKDSSDAIVHADGSQVEAPIATAEEQAYEYIAKLRMSELLWWFDERDGAKRFWDEAAELKKRFNDVFWMEDEGFYAMGLDPKQRLIRSISSNPGHCLAAGIVDTAHSERTALRMMQEDMYSGWGIRTLSAKHPAFNPYSYHRGSVWPAEHGAFSLGLARYGFHEHVQRIAKSLFETAVMFDFNRMPELFTGHQRDADHPFPAFYPRANWPQAWSAGTTFLLIQAMLSLYPYAPLNALIVDPHLPEWLPEITLSNLHVGGAVVEIRFFRGADGATDYRVEDLRGTLHVIHQPSPWSVTSGPAERIKDAIMSFLPGR